MNRRIIILCTAFALVLCLAASAFAAPKVVRVSFTVAAGSIWDRGAQKFKQLVEERSKGAFLVEVYPSGTLASGNDRVELEMAQAGAIDIVMKSTTWLTQMDKRFFVVALPWLFRDDEAAMGFMDGPIGQMLSADLSKKIGLLPLAWGSGSFFQLYTNKGPVKTPADIQGIKIRVPGNEVFVGAWKNIGAVPVTMSFGEVFPALQSGAIDGGTSPVPLIYSSKFYEVSKHVSINNCAFEAIGVVVGSPFWSGLKADEQKLIKEAAVDAMKFQRAEALKEDAKLIAEMQQKGVTVTVLSQTELAPFKEKVQPLYKDASTRYGEEFMKQVEAEVKKLNAK